MDRRRDGLKRKDDLIPEAIEIREKLKNGFPRQPTFNILMLGAPGAGKSSLINSMIAAVDKNGYRERVIRGAGGAGGQTAVTSVLEGVQMFDDERFCKEDEHKYKCRPVFWDFPGLMDSNERDLLQMLLKGHTLPRTSLSQMKSTSAKFWDWFKYLAENDKRMHLIIYVQAANVAPPEQLLGSIVSVVRSQEKSEYETTTFVVLTHADKMKVLDKDIDLGSLSSVEDESERLEKIREMKEKKRKEKLHAAANSAATYLKMQGVTERMVKLSCYSCETAGDEDFDIQRNHLIDKQMCKLWAKILEPDYYKQFK